MTDVANPPFPLSAFTADLIHNEDEKLRPYKDSLGNWTAGVGHFIGNAQALTAWKKLYPPTGQLNPNQSRILLAQDIAATLIKLDRYVPWWRKLSPCRQRVLADMMFNMGWGNGDHGLSSFAGTLKCINGADYHGASLRMAASVWGHQVGNRMQRDCWMLVNDNGRWPAKFN